MSRTLIFHRGDCAVRSLLCIPKLTAQGGNAAIVGSCFDSSGAALPMQPSKLGRSNNLKSESKTTRPATTFFQVCPLVPTRSPSRGGIQVGSPFGSDPARRRRARLDFTAEVE